MTRTVVSYSELDTFRQCPLKHNLAYKQRWTRDKDDESALTKGTLWHAVLETHYREIQKIQSSLGRRIHPEEEPTALKRCGAAATAILTDSRSGVQTPAQELVEWMYRGYTQMYGLDRDWWIVAVEHAAEIPLPTNTSGRKSPKYSIKMKIDLVVKDRRSNLWVVDHKSCSRLPAKREYDLDDQFGLYTWGMRQLGHPVEGSVHSAARTQRNKGDAEGTKPMGLDERFARTPMFRTDAELNNIALDAYRAAHASRTTGIPFSSPNPDTCGWRCDFREAHLDMRKGLDPRRSLADRGFYQDKTRH